RSRYRPDRVGTPGPPQRDTHPYCAPLDAHHYHGHNDFRRLVARPLALPARSLALTASPATAHRLPPLVYGRRRLFDAQLEEHVAFLGVIGRSLPCRGPHRRIVHPRRSAAHPQLPLAPVLVGYQRMDAVPRVPPQVVTLWSCRLHEREQPAI